MAPDELSIIDRYFRPLAGEGAFGLRDDAARLSVPPGRELVVTADMLAVGVHFLAGDPPETIARKALRVNLSDLAAKGAEPLCYTLSVGLGPGCDAAWLESFAEGLRLDQAAFGLELLGGDTVAFAAGPVIAVTAFGSVPEGRMVHRFGGRPGDALYVSGEIGAGAAGLALLKGRAGPWDALPAPEQENLVDRFRVPLPRTGLSAALHEFASAAMDISDGLVGDCDKLAGASGCGAAVQAERVPLPPGLERLGDGDLAGLLSGGDDYEILAAVPPAREEAFRRAATEAAIPVARIGELTDKAGLTQVRRGAEPLPFAQRAYVHRPV